MTGCTVKYQPCQITPNIGTHFCFLILLKVTTKLIYSWNLPGGVPGAGVKSSSSKKWPYYYFSNQHTKTKNDFRDTVHSYWTNSRLHAHTRADADAEESAKCSLMFFSCFPAASFCSNWIMIIYVQVYTTQSTWG